MQTAFDSTRRFTVIHFSNNNQYRRLENLNAKDAYDKAIPPQSLLPANNNFWHVLMRQPALEKMSSLALNAEFKVCYNDENESVMIKRVK